MAAARRRSGGRRGGRLGAFRRFPTVDCYGGKARRAAAPPNREGKTTPPGNRAGGRDESGRTDGPPRWPLRGVHEDVSHEAASRPHDDHDRGLLRPLTLEGLPRPNTMGTTTPPGN